MRYLEIEDEQYQVGTTKGWGDFIRWADSLDLDENYALIQFAEHGHTEAPSDVLDELKASLTNDPPPDAATRDVATNLLSVLRAHDGADFFAVSDGTEHGDESEK
jgi:hypothetical protein